MPIKVLSTLEALRDEVREEILKDPRYITFVSLERSIQEISAALEGAGLLPRDRGGRRGIPGLAADTPRLALGAPTRPAPEPSDGRDAEETSLADLGATDPVLATVADLPPHAEALPQSDPTTLGSTPLTALHSAPDSAAEDLGLAEPGLTAVADLPAHMDPASLIGSETDVSPAGQSESDRAAVSGGSAEHVLPDQLPEATEGAEGTAAEHSHAEAPPSVAIHGAPPAEAENLTTLLSEQVEVDTLTPIESAPAEAEHHGHQHADATALADQAFETAPEEHAVVDEVIETAATTEPAPEHVNAAPEVAVEHAHHAEAVEHAASAQVADEAIHEHAEEHAHLEGVIEHTETAHRPEEATLAEMPSATVTATEHVATQHVHVEPVSEHAGAYDHAESTHEEAGASQPHATTEHAPLDLAAEEQTTAVDLAAVVTPDEAPAASDAVHGHAELAAEPAPDYVDATPPQEAAKQGHVEGTSADAVVAAAKSEAEARSAQEQAEGVVPPIESGHAHDAHEHAGSSLAEAETAEPTPATAYSLGDHADGAAAAEPVTESVAPPPHAATDHAQAEPHPVVAHEHTSELGHPIVPAEDAHPDVAATAEPTIHEHAESAIGPEAATPHAAVELTEPATAAVHAPEISEAHLAPPHGHDEPLPIGALADISEHVEGPSEAMSAPLGEDAPAPAAAHPVAEREHVEDSAAEHGHEAAAAPIPHHEHIAGSAVEIAEPPVLPELTHPESAPAAAEHGIHGHVEPSETAEPEPVEVGHAGDEPTPVVEHHAELLLPPGGEHENVGGAEAAELHASPEHAHSTPVHAAADPLPHHEHIAGSAVEAAEVAEPPVLPELTHPESAPAAAEHGIHGRVEPSETAEPEPVEVGHAGDEPTPVVEHHAELLLPPGGEHENVAGAEAAELHASAEHAHSTPVHAAAEHSDVHAIEPTPPAESIEPTPTDAIPSVSEESGAVSPLEPVEAVALSVAPEHTHTEAAVAPTPAPEPTESPIPATVEHLESAPAHEAAHSAPTDADHGETGLAAVDHVTTHEHAEGSVAAVEDATAAVAHVDGGSTSAPAAMPHGATENELAEPAPAAAGHAAAPELSLYEPSAGELEKHEEIAVAPATEELEGATAPILDGSTHPEPISAATGHEPPGLAESPSEPSHMAATHPDEHAAPPPTVSEPAAPDEHAKSEVVAPSVEHVAPELMHPEPITLVATEPVPEVDPHTESEAAAPAMPHLAAPVEPVHPEPAPAMAEHPVPPAIDAGAEHEPAESTIVTPALGQAAGAEETAALSPAEGDAPPQAASLHEASLASVEPVAEYEHRESAPPPHPSAEPAERAQAWAEPASPDGHVPESEIAGAPTVAVHPAHHDAASSMPEHGVEEALTELADIAASPTVAEPAQAEPIAVAAEQPAEPGTSAHPHIEAPEIAPTDASAEHEPAPHAVELETSHAPAAAETELPALGAHDGENIQRPSSRLDTIVPPPLEPIVAHAPLSRVDAAPHAEDPEPPAKVGPTEIEVEAEPNGKASASDKAKPAPALAGTFRIVHDPEENAFYFTRHPS